MRSAAPTSLVFRGRDVLFEGEGRDDASLPADPASFTTDAIVDREVDLPDGTSVRGVLVAPAWEPPAGMSFRSLRGALLSVDERPGRVLGRVLQILEWDRDHRHCGRCGAPTREDESDRSRRCDVCELVFYPRVAPAVIVLVWREREVLLGRSPYLPEGMYSTLAGFVEAGESLEETVAREILEEVGVEVEDVRYFGSQPWPFPHSLMVGFHARWAGGEIVPDPAEIEDAQWFPVDALPQIPPRLSIARHLIDDFIARPDR